MTRKSKGSNIGAAFIMLLLIVFSVMTVHYLCVRPIIDLEHYNRVYKNPICVNAVVTSHDVYDYEGDTDYRSYISYTVDNVKYEDIKLQDVNDKEDLYKKGTEIIVEVSPEDPGRLISDLKKSGYKLSVTIVLAVVLLSSLGSQIIRGRRSKKLSHTPDREEITKNAKLTILGRFSLTFFLLVPIAYAILYHRYPTIMPEWTIYVAAGCGIVWLWKVIVAVIDIKNILSDNYTVTRDILIDKRIISGDDSDSYQLTYSSSTNGNQWKTNTSRHYYDRAKTGSTVTSIYLPNKKKPLYHYDNDGDAL